MKNEDNEINEITIKEKDKINEVRYIITEIKDKIDEKYIIIYKGDQVLDEKKISSYNITPSDFLIYKSSRKGEFRYIFLFW